MRVTCLLSKLVVLYFLHIQSIGLHTLYFPFYKMVRKPIEMYSDFIICVLFHFHVQVQLMRHIKEMANVLLPTDRISTWALGIHNTYGKKCCIYAMRYERIFSRNAPYSTVKLLKGLFIINHAGLIMNSDRGHDVNSAIPFSFTLGFKKNNNFF